jgi:hypothetical protein
LENNYFLVRRRAMKRIFLSLCLTIFICLGAVTCGLAADTVTATDTVVTTPGSTRGIRVITWTYSSDDGTIAETAAVTAITGILVGAKHIPDGTNTPDAAADYTIKDASSGGMDVLFGAGANIGTSRTIVYPVESVNSGPVFLANATLYFAAASLGAGTNAGTFAIYIALP